MIWTAVTNPFGAYTIEDLPVGETYFIEVSHKRYIFDTRSLSLKDNLVDVDFTAQPE
jgi:hypothetical protein